jgi:hypothetical protein
LYGGRTDGQDLNRRNDMKHEPKKGDITASAQFINQDKLFDGFKEVATLKLDWQEKQTLTLQQGSWKIMHDNFEKIFVATEDKPITFKRLDD